MPSDLWLVKNCQKGDHRAFETLILKYQHRVFSLIYHLLRKRNIVEDVAQEVFLKVFKSIKSFRGTASFYTWLYRITVNTCLNYQKSARSSELTLSCKEPHKEAFMAQRTKDPEEHIRDKESSQVIKEVIESLTVEQRMPIILRELEGLSYEEIAVVLECPVGTVRSKIFRARKVLQEKLKGYFYEY